MTKILYVEDNQANMDLVCRILRHVGGYDVLGAVDGESGAILDKQAAWLRSYPNTIVTIEGHADERGTREYNLALGERRAQAVKNYLTSLGIAPNRLNTISYGKERPAVLGNNPAAWKRNRRGVMGHRATGLRVDSV